MDEVRNPRTGGSLPGVGPAEGSREENASSEALLDYTDPRLREVGSGWSTRWSPAGKAATGRGSSWHSGICQGKQDLADVFVFGEQSDPWCAWLWNMV